jgi:hypothetical protein
VSAKTTPTALARGRFVTIVDGHAEAELSANGQGGRQAQRARGKLDFVVSLLGGGIANHHGFGRAGAFFGAAGTGFVHDDDLGAKRGFDTAEGVVVEGDLGGAIGAGDHELDGVAVPGAVRGVFMVVVGDDETEVDVVGVVDDLNRGGLVIRDRSRCRRRILRRGRRSRGQLVPEISEWRTSDRRGTGTPVHSERLPLRTTGVVASAV